MVLNSKTPVFLKKFWFHKHVKMVLKPVNRSKVTFLFRQDLTHLQVIDTSDNYSKAYCRKRRCEDKSRIFIWKNPVSLWILLIFNRRWWYCLHNYLYRRWKWFPATRWTYSNTTSNTSSNIGFIETNCRRSITTTTTRIPITAKRCRCYRSISSCLNKN